MGYGKRSNKCSVGEAEGRGVKPTGDLIGEGCGEVGEHS